nr:fibronectin type III-like domain-contianing protein [Bacteroidota bacterium]
SVPVPIRSLAGFERIFLESGKEKTINFIIDPRQLSLIDENSERILEPGDFLISAGGSQPGQPAETKSFIFGTITVEGQKISFSN